MALDNGFLKTLKPEDFDSQYQNLISQLAFVLNPAIQQIITIYNNGLDISDLNVQVKQLTLSVDSTGNPTTTASFISTLSGNCSSLQVARAQNLTKTTTYPTGGVFASFSLNGTQIVLTNITGLTIGDQWQLTVIAYV